MPRACSDTSELTRQLVEQIATDRIRGASQLARLALELILEYIHHTATRNPAHLAKGMADLAQQLSGARPSMAAISNLIDRWFEDCYPNEFHSAEELRSHVTVQTKNLIRQSEQAVTLAAQQAASRVSAGQTIMTHSCSSTIRALFQQLTDKNIKAIVTESQPGCEGAILAQDLAEMTIPVSYITDAQMGLFVSKADKIFVGADTLLADGALVNKSGTYLLALAANDLSIPFYVCCESHKQSKLKASEVTLERGGQDEIAITAYPGIIKQNVYFDITPARLISSWINEQGIYHYD